MTENSIVQIILFLFILLLLVKPLGWYMSQVYAGKPCGMNRLCYPIERFIYRICRIDMIEEMNWKKYLIAMLCFNLLGLLAVYFIQRLQFYLPLNPQSFHATSPDLALNTASSFVTNTNWQSYSGETTMSYLTQMIALTVQNFLSAATGMALLVALIRGIVNHESNDLGNFWVDLVRGILYILLPLAFILSIVLTSQGVIENFKPNIKVNLLQQQLYQIPITDSSGQPIKDANGNPKTESKLLTEQTIPMGPVASQIAIKQLGTNGGGFFNTNAAHPFENGTPFTNFLEMLAIIIIPAAFCYTFGVMVNDKRQGWAILAAMFFIFIPFLFFADISEQKEILLSPPWALIKHRNLIYFPVATWKAKKHVLVLLILHFGQQQQLQLQMVL